MQIQISWLLQKPTDLDLHCLQRQGISGFSRTRVKVHYKLFSWYVDMHVVFGIIVNLIPRLNLVISVRLSVTLCIQPGMVRARILKFYI